MQPANKNKKSLQIPFEAAVNWKQYRPAIAFERHAKIRGVAGRYVFPEGMTSGKLEGAIWALPQEKLFLPLFCATWEQLLSLNEELKEIVVDKKNTREVNDALWGVTSGFNIDDIRYYMDLRRKGKKPAAYSRSQPETGRIIDDIEQRVGKAMQWVPSPTTLKKIKSKLDKKDQQRRRNLSPKM